VQLTVANPDGLVGVPYLPVLAANPLTPSADRNPGIAGENVVNAFAAASLAADGTLSLTLRPIAEISSLSRDAGLLATLEGIAARCSVAASNLDRAGFLPAYDASDGDLFLFAAGVDPTLPGAEALGFVTLSALQGGSDTRLLLVASRQAWSFATTAPCAEPGSDRLTEVALVVTPGWQLLRIVDGENGAGLATRRWTIAPLSSLDPLALAGLAYLDPEDAISEPVHLAFTVSNESNLEGSLYLPTLMLEGAIDSQLEEPLELNLSNALRAGTLNAAGEVALTFRPVSEVRVPNGSSLFAQILNEILVLCPMTGVNVGRALLHPVHLFDAFEATLLVFAGGGEPAGSGPLEDPVAYINLSEAGGEGAEVIVLFVASETQWSVGTDGPCTRTFGNQNSTIEVDLRAQPGWQLLYLRQLPNGGGGVDFRMTLEPLALLAQNRPVGSVYLVSGF
jgi:hypothetical protein